MKRYFLKLALLTLGVTTLVSCDEDTVTYGGQNFVTFDNVSSTRYPFFENGGISEIQVNMAFPQSSDVAVGFTVESDVAVAGTDYNLLTPNSITIPAGETSALIRIEVIDNTILDDSKAIAIKLTTVSDANTAIGLADVGSKEKNFLIVNNDCTTNAFNWYGDLLFETSGGGDSSGTAFADVTDEGTCNTLLIKGDFAGLGRAQAAPIRFTFTPTGTNVPALTGGVRADEQLWCEKCYTDAGKDYNILYSGTGQYNTNTGRIIFTGTTKVDGIGSLTETTVFSKP